MEFTTDKYNNIFPIWQISPLNNLVDDLKEFVGRITPKYPRCAIIAEIPFADPISIPMFKLAGFELYYANNDKSVWIIKNESMMPPIYYGYAGIQMFCIRDNGATKEILLVEEKYKIGWGPIAGAADNNEFPRVAACRELREEVGLIAKPETLKLICSRIRRKANAVGATNYDYYFLCDDFAGEININPDEIVRYKWIDVHKLASESIIDGLNISPILKDIANNIISSKNTYFKKMIDCRQWNKEIKDESDVLHLEYIN